MFFQRWLYAWRVRLRGLFKQQEVDCELDEELQYHLALEVELRRARGIAPDEARRQALAALGGLAATREQVRESRFGASLEQVYWDVRFGLRILRREPGFTAAMVLTLTLAIGATTTIFAVMDAVLLQPPPFPASDRLVTLQQTGPESGDLPAEVTPATFLDWRDRALGFEHMVGVEPFAFNFSSTEGPERLSAFLVTEGFFEALGVDAAHGRTFRAGEFGPDSSVVVLTDGLWRRRFGGDADIIGRALALDGQRYTVVGVLPPDFELRLERGRAERDLFAPKAITEYETVRRAGGWWHVIGRLRLETTLAEAQAEMDALSNRLAADYPGTNAGIGVRVTLLGARQVEVVRPALLLLWGAAIFVLLIACVNVANLMLAQGARRAQEFALRTAVGGGRGRLFGQLLTESLMIAALGGLGGLAVTAGALDALASLIPPDVPRLSQIVVSGRIVGFAAGLVVFTAMAFGCMPAVQLLRQDVSGPLVRGPWVGRPVGKQRTRRMLVAGEVALAVVLLVGAGLLLQSFARLVNVDLGFAPRDMVALQVFYPENWSEATENFFGQTLDDIRALPGVVAVGAVSAFPLALADVTIQSPLKMHDRPPPPPGEEPAAAVSFATAGYFEAMQIPLREGRLFNDQDDAAGPAVAVINETLARQHWPGSDPIARRLTVEGFRRAFEVDIVGVVGAVRPDGFDSRPRPEVFISHAHHALGRMTYVVRASGDPAASISAIRDVIRAVDPRQPIYSAATVEQLLSDTLATRRFVTFILTLFGVAALGLAGVGIYGVVAVATAQRTHEIGMRLALGAQPGQVVRMVVRSALGLAGAGVVAGLLVALVTSQALATLLFEVSPADIKTLAGVSLLLLALAAGSAHVPARRAARVDPLVAIHTDIGDTRRQ